MTNAELRAYARRAACGAPLEPPTCVEASNTMRRGRPGGLKRTGDDRDWDWVHAVCGREATRLVKSVMDGTSGPFCDACARFYAEESRPMNRRSAQIIALQQLLDVLSERLEP
jgi:hypothetical protein